MNKKDFKKISDFKWELPKSFHPAMRVPAVCFASDRIVDEIFRDHSMDQLANVTTLPGILKAAFAMPDAHEGYGFCIGGVAAMSYDDGVISPGGVGYDVNCGIRLLESNTSYKEIQNKLEDLTVELFKQVPSGVGRGGRLTLSNKDMHQVLKEGAQWMVKSGYGSKEDLLHLESYGKLEGANPSVVSEHAKKRGRDQLGTIGAGNHFVEIDVVDQIFDADVAQAFGLYENQIVFLIHTGSRGLGHQVCTDYLKKVSQVMTAKYKIRVPDRQLACVPFHCEEGQNYFQAMAAAANFAWANRQMITWEVREAWKNVLKGEGGALNILYDLAHNIAKIEEHDIDGKIQKVIVHRKGATRAFGPGHPELIDSYRKVGQPVLIPGSMGTASYVLVGTQKAMMETFGSSCHGAGRRMSRSQAKREVEGPKLLQELKSKGIHVQAGSMRGLAEEAPTAYKDVDSVVDVVHHAGIARKVARLKPVGVMKG